MGKKTAITTPKLSKELRELRLKLNPKQCCFVDHLFSPMKAYEAYQLAYGKTSTQQIASTNASRLIHQGPTGEYCKQLKLEAWRANMLTREEKRSLLARIARTPVTEIVGQNGAVIEENADLVQEIQTSVDKDGMPVTKVKLPAKLEAIKIDNAMTGDNAPEEHQHSITGLLSSLPSTVDLPSKRASLLPGAQPG